MPGDFFKEKENKIEKKKEDLIEDADEWVSTFNLENQKYQNTYDQSYEAILPTRQKLRGGTDMQNIGMLNEQRNHLKTSKIANMMIGQKMFTIIDETETLDNLSERYAEYLEKHIVNYQFLCKSAIQIIDGLYNDINDMTAKIEAKEEHIENLTTEPGEVIIPPNEDKKQELVGIYKNLQTSLQFALLVNPKRDGKNFTPGERAYLKEVNKELQRFKGTRRKELVTEKSAKNTKESTNLPKSQPEPQVYSPLSQKQENKDTPLNKENPQ